MCGPAPFRRNYLGTRGIFFYWLILQQFPQQCLKEGICGIRLRRNGNFRKLEWNHPWNKCLRRETEYFCPRNDLLNHGIPLIALPYIYVFGSGFSAHYTFSETLRLLERN